MWRGSYWLLWQGQRLLLVSYLGLAMRQLRLVDGKGPENWTPSHSLFLGLGCQSCVREEPWVKVIQGEDGSYQATLCGNFTIQVSGEHAFRARLLMLFLRLLDAPDYHRGSRRTRDGRTPFVRQQQAATWFHMPQPDISRDEGYWQQGGWPELLSRCTPEILTPELVRRIVTLCATHPHWKREEVYQHLQGQNVSVSRRQARQAMERGAPPRWTSLRLGIQHLAAGGPGAAGQ